MGQHKQFKFDIFFSLELRFKLQSQVHECIPKTRDTKICSNETEFNQPFDSLG